MSTDEEHEGLPTAELEYFNDQVGGDDLEFFRRMGPLEFSGKAVLDMGCGHGSIALHAARQGASRVLGVDIDPVRIDFARRNILLNYPEYSSVISFHNGSLDELDDEFDLAVSKDSFEHIDDLSAVMRSIAEHLSHDGVLVTGFSPMYFSPYGDHGRFFLGRLRKVPWLPALLPERALFRLSTRSLGQDISSASDLGLNKLTPKGFRAIVAGQGWRVIAWQTNCGEKRGLRLMSTLAKVKILEKYFTVSVYAQLGRPEQ